MSELPEAHRAAVVWLRWAREDLALGEHGFGNEALAPRGACVWAHQAGEKAIKSLLVVHDVDPPTRHDLDRLARLLPAVEVERFAVLDLPELSRWAMEGRYPMTSTKQPERSRSSWLERSSRPSRLASKRSSTLTQRHRSLIDRPRHEDPVDRRAVHAEHGRHLAHPEQLRNRHRPRRRRASSDEGRTC